MNWDYSYGRTRRITTHKVENLGDPKGSGVSLDS